MTFETIRSLSKGQCPHSMADMFFFGYCTPVNTYRGNLSQFNDIIPPFRSSNCPAQKMWISCLPTAVITPIYGWSVESWCHTVYSGFCLGWMWTRRQPQELCKPKPFQNTVNVLYGIEPRSVKEVEQAHWFLPNHSYSMFTSGPFAFLRMAMFHSRNSWT